MWRWKAPAVAAAVALLALTPWAVRYARSSPAPSRPVVAVVQVRNVTGDTSVAWLSDGFRQMISGALARSEAVEVITPDRIRDVVARRGLVDNHLQEAETRQIAERAGATLAVSAVLTSREGAYALEVNVIDVASGKAQRLFSVTGKNAVAVADEAAARVRGAVDDNAPGPRLAELESANPEAFRHFIRAQQAGAEGRLSEGMRELDAAIETDSGFVSAIVARMRTARALADVPTLMKLNPLFQRARGRLTEFDRLDQGAYEAFHNGEHQRAEQLAAELVRRYPHDPRAYSQYATILGHHGKWAMTDTVLRKALALDSLAAEAGHGPCAPCAAFAGLADLRMLTGDFAGAERIARRWTVVQPDVPSSWSSLSSVLQFTGKFDEALVHARRAAALSPADLMYQERIARTFVMARRYEEAEAAIAQLRASGSEGAASAYDVDLMLKRERGQFRAALASIDSATRLDSNMASTLMAAQLRAWAGDPARARRDYERVGHMSDPMTTSPVYSRVGDLARSYSWHHALEADAIAPTADTMYLRALADSLEMRSARSYYGRDWVLHHHVRGLIALRARDYPRALREFEQARWTVAGWTRTLEGLAEAALALQQPGKAIVALRDAYKGPLDAMGRYMPRSEMDYWMAQAFAQAGQRDSATVYAGYVRRAWAGADAPVRTRLASLR